MRSLSRRPGNPGARNGNRIPWSGSNRAPGSDPRQRHFPAGHDQGQQVVERPVVGDRGEQRADEPAEKPGGHRHGVALQRARSASRQHGGERVRASPRALRPLEQPPRRPRARGLPARRRNMKPRTRRCRFPPPPESARCAFRATAPCVPAGCSSGTRPAPTPVSGRSANARCLPSSPSSALRACR